jgi:hypothetical protein
MNQNGPEVGQRIEFEGQGYWITKVTGMDLEVMPDPDDAKRKARSNFWPTFWVIVLIIVILKMI